MSSPLTPYLSTDFTLFPQADPRAGEPMNDTHHGHGKHAGHDSHAGPQPACCRVGAIEHATDPVCRMNVDPRSAAGSLEHAGKRYYFCSKHCLEKFRSDPGRYVPASAATTETDPVCGMTVDPRSAAGSHAHAGKTYYFCSTHCLHAF